MFDNIKCEMPLPQYGDSGGFQTKSLDNTLSLYVINEYGELLKRECEYEWEEGNPDAESFADRLPRANLISSKMVETKYNGEIVFYDSWKGENNEDLEGLIDYKAIFMNGLLQGEIEILNKEEPRNFTEEEIERNNKWRQEAAERRLKVKEEKIAKIEKVRTHIKALSEAQEAIYNNLVSDLHFTSKQEEWLWDAIFNDFDFSMEKVKEYL